MVGARAIQEIQKEKGSKWHGIDLCVGGESAGEK